MTCPDCLKAKTRLWMVFNHHCEGCLFRMIACMDEEQREKEFDAVELKFGKPARHEAVRCVTLELARIRALKGEVA